MRVGLDSDHGYTRGIWATAEQQDFSHSFAARRDALGQRFVHYYHRWFRLLRILTREGAPSKNGHSERFEISVAHGRLNGQRPYSIGWRWFPFYAERRGGNAVQHGESRSNCRGPDAWNARNAPQQLVTERFHSFRILIFRRSQIHVHSQQMIGSESRRDGEQGSHTADHQAGAGQQDQREGDFTKPQNIAQTS